MKATNIPIAYVPAVDKAKSRSRENKQAVFSIYKRTASLHTPCVCLFVVVLEVSRTSVGASVTWGELHDERQPGSPDVRLAVGLCVFRRVLKVGTARYRSIQGFCSYEDKNGRSCIMFIRLLGTW